MQILKPGTRVPLAEEPNNPVAFAKGLVSPVAQAQFQRFSWVNGNPVPEEAKAEAVPDAVVEPVAVSETMEVRSEKSGKVTSETISYRRVGRILRECRDMGPGKKGNA